MNIPVCAHMNLGPFVHRFGRFDSIAEAVSIFRIVVEQHYGVLDKSIAEIWQPYEMPCVDLYPQCGDCTSDMNFHDYPMARWQVGPRGGVNRIMI